ncbi:MAG TPA: hypothetical protein VE957_03420 [Terriglobales bacterium]|nr:hypothetical protein [Terriglobales bacterium]
MIRKFGALVITLLSPLAAAQSVELRWVQSASPSVVSNIVYRAAVRKGPYIAIFGSTEPITEYADVDVMRGEIYCYVVTAVDANGVESGYSNKVCRKVPKKGSEEQ